MQRIKFPKLPPINLHSKKTQLAIRFFTYGVMTLATIVISAIVLFLALGYRFDNNKGTFEQGGLLQFRSFPSDASVYVNGKRQTQATPGKAHVPAGKYEVAMELDGYKTWRKDVSVSAGQLLWLNYIRFVPENVTTNVVKEYPAIHNSLTAPNRRYMILQPSATEARFIVADIRNEERFVYTDLVLPAASYAQLPEAGHTFEIIEWNLGGRYLLIKHITGNITEILRIDRQQPQQVVNLTAKFGPITKAQFAGNSGDTVFGLIGEQLYRLDTGATDIETGGEIIGEGLTNFLVYKSDNIAYVANRENRQSVGVIKDDRDVTVTTYPAEEPVKIALNNYFNSDYLAVATKNTVEIFREPAAATNVPAKMFTKYSIDKPAIDFLYFSNNGRMLVAQHQASISVYDLELAETYNRDFGSSLPVTERFQWLDDYYLIVDLDNSLRIVEFDGTNERLITQSLTGQTVTLSENGEMIYSLGANNVTKAVELQRSQLVLQP